MRVPRGAGVDGDGGAMRLPLLVRDLAAASLQLHAATAGTLAVAPTDLAALHQLAAGPLSHRELGRRLGLRPASTTTVVDRLVARGHAARVPSTADSRIVHVVSTDDGKAAARGVLRTFVERLRHLQSERTPAEIETIALFLAEVIRAMRESAG